MTLPRNLLEVQDSLYEDFEHVADWALDYGAMEANGAQFSTGTQSIKLISSSPNGYGRMTLALPGWDLSRMERLSFWMYLDDPLANYDHISISLSSSTSSMSRRLTYVIWPPAYCAPGLPYGAPGAPRLVTATRPEFASVGGETWDSPFIRLVIEVQGDTDTKVVSASFDNLRLGASGSHAAVMLSFDDGYTVQYTTAFPIMQARGIRGTVYAISENVGWSPYMSWDQLRDLQSAGWSVANHTANHEHLPELGAPQQQDCIASCRAALQDHGLTGGSYIAYPWGDFDANTMSAMSNLGMLTGRTTVSTRQAVLPSYDIWNVEAYSIDQSVPLDTAKRLIDKAVERKAVASLLFHGISSTNFTPANFTALMDYIRDRAVSGLITPITVDDYFRLTQGPVTVPIPA